MFFGAVHFLLAEKPEHDLSMFYGSVCVMTHGLHLRWDHYHYDYGVAQVGDRRSAVSIRCELRGA